MLENHVDDVVIAVPWLAVNALLAAAAWRWSGRLAPRDALSQRLTHVVILTWAAVVGAATVLGTVGALTGQNLLVVTGVAAAAAWRAGGRGAVVPWAGRRAHSWELVWQCLFAAWTGHVITGALFPFPNHWDALGYHIPLVDQWLQGRSLYAPDCSHWSHPGNAELLGLWMVAPFSGDFLLGLSNLPVGLLLALAARDVARQLGLGGTLAHLAALAVVGDYVVVGQLVSFENDLAAAALFLACLNYGLRYSRRGLLADLVFGAISLGLLAGVKYYALGYAAGAGAIVVLLAARRRGARGAVWAVAAGLLGTLLLAGYWYTRNLLVTGSPLYPLGGTDADQAADSFYPAVWESTFLGSGRAEVLPLALIALAKIGGPCPLAALCVLPASLVWLPWTGIRRWSTAGPGAAARLALALAVLSSGAVLLVTPFAVECVPGTLDQLRWERTPVRYSLTLLSVATMAAALMLQDLTRASRPALRRVVRWSAAGAVALQFTLAAANPPRGLTSEVMRGLHVELVETLLWAVNLFLLGRVLSLGRRHLPAVAFGGMILALGLAGAVAVGRLGDRWHARFAVTYDTFLGDAVFSYLAASGDATERFCVLDDRPYPFFGSRRQFRICQPVVLSTPDDLYSYLGARRATFLITRSAWTSAPTNVPHHSWAVDAVAADPRAYTLWREGNSFCMYRVNPGARPSALAAADQSRP